MKGRIGRLAVIAALTYLPLYEVQAQVICVKDPNTGRLINPSPEISPTCILPTDPVPDKRETPPPLTTPPSSDRADIEKANRAKGIELKEMGNRAFEKRAWEEAIDFYRQALQYLREDTAIQRNLEAAETQLVISQSGVFKPTQTDLTVRPEMGSTETTLDPPTDDPPAGDHDTDLEPPPAGRVTACQKAARRAEADLREIRRQRRSNELNREEMAEWSSASKQAQTDALKAAVFYVAGVFIDDLDAVRSSVAKLERRAATMDKKAAFSKKHTTRLKYLAELHGLLEELQPRRLKLMAREVTKVGMDVNAVWQLSKNTMQHEFRVARNRNQKIHEMLKEPEFKETFAGEDLDTPGLEVVSTLTDQAVEETGKFLMKARRYERLVGPAVSAGAFARDTLYSALLSYHSTQRVLQQSSLASVFAKSLRALQKQYQNDIDAVRACRQSGYLK